MGTITRVSRPLFLRDSQGEWQQGHMATAFVQASGLVHGQAAVEEYQRLCNP